MDNNSKPVSIMSASISMTLKHYKSLLGYSCFVALLYAAIALGYHFVQRSENKQLLILVMAGWLLWLPVLSGYIHFHGKRFTKEQTNFKDSVMAGFSQTLPILTTFVGLLLIPALLLGAVAITWFFTSASNYGQIVWPLLGLAILLSVLLINRQALSLVIVSLTVFDSMQAMGHCSQLIKGHYWRTLLRSTLPLFILIGLFTGPLWLSFIVPMDFQLELLAILGACFDIILIAPFFWSMMIIDLHDLERRHLQSRPQKVEKMRQKIPDAPKGKMNEDDWF